MRKALRISVITLLLLLVILGGLHFVHRSRSRNALARYKAELRAKGEKLTFAELNWQRPMTKEELACRDLFKVNRLSGFTAPAPFEHISAGKMKLWWHGELHVGAPDSDGMYEVKTLDELKRQIEQDSKALSLIRTALKHPALDSGWDYTHKGESANIALRSQRDAANALLSQLVEDLRQRDLASAVTNFQALAALAQLFRNEPDLFSQSLRITAARLAARATWQCLQVSGWTDDQLGQMQRGLEQIYLIDALENGLTGDRAAGQALMAKARQWTYHEFRTNAVPTVVDSDQRAWPISFAQKTGREMMSYMRVISYKAGAMDQDERWQLDNETRVIEMARLLTNAQMWPEIRQKQAQHEREVERGWVDGTYGRSLIGIYYVPFFTRPIGRVAQVEAERGLAINALAIKRYELKYGHPHSKLESLLNDLLKEPLIDPMSGRDFCFHTNLNGTYVLYSVGWDGKDNGGDATPSAVGGAFSLWECKDAVWPVAATREEVAAYEAAIQAKRNNK